MRLLLRITIGTTCTLAAASALLTLALVASTTPNPPLEWAGPGFTEPAAPVHSLALN